MKCIGFFKQKTAYELRISDWSSDVCSSDLPAPRRARKATSGAVCGNRSASLLQSSLPCEGRGGLGRGAFGSVRTVTTPSQPPPAFAGGGARPRSRRHDGARAAAYNGGVSLPDERPMRHALPVIACLVLPSAGCERVAVTADAEIGRAHV